MTVEFLFIAIITFLLMEIGISSVAKSSDEPVVTSVAFQLFSSFVTYQWHY